jgi:IS605 OrfB family transposase
MLQTYQTRLKTIPLHQDLTSEMYLDQYGQLFGRMERKLFVLIHIKKMPSNQVKKEFCRQYHITSRQYNSLKMQLDGKVSSILEIRKIHITELEEKISNLTCFIEKKEKQKEILHKKIVSSKQTHPKWMEWEKKFRNLKFVLHQKKRRLRNLEQKLFRLKQDEVNQKIRICFGSKKLFHKQFHLEENEYQNHDQWKQDWLESRSAQFLVIGSKDETFGNQSATYDLKNNLRLRVADHFMGVYGKYIDFPDVKFPYGQEYLDQAKQSYFGSTRSGKSQKYFTAITYRFIKKRKGWYLNATVDCTTTPIGTSKNNGLIGIDLNAGFLSICEIDRFGNPLKERQIKIPMYGRSKEQIFATMSDALKEITEYAVLVQKNIVIEKLNFSRKRSRLREMGSKYARMLSGFAYSSFSKLIQSKAKKMGAKVHLVNSAYTSQIGHMKFMPRYGLSSHGSAACVIARRGYFYRTEKPKYDTALPLPKSFNKEKSNYSNWKTISAHTKKVYSFHDKIELLKIDG